LREKAISWQPSAAKNDAVLLIIDSIATSPK